MTLEQVVNGIVKELEYTFVVKLASLVENTFKKMLDNMENSNKQNTQLLLGEIAKMHDLSNSNNNNDVEKEFLKIHKQLANIIDKIDRMNNNGTSVKS